MREHASRVKGVDLDEDYDIRFEVTDISRRYHRSKLTLYFKVKAHREPWIKSEVHERIHEALVKARVKFRREAPR